MDEDTAATDISSKDLEDNCKALRKCLGGIRATANVRNILDIRYGLGGWAKVALAKFPNATYLGYEQSEEVARRAWKDNRVDLRIARWKPVRRGYKIDLLLADFNNATVLKRKQLDEVIAAVKSRYLVFTDVCCSKLHLNYGCYGLEEASLSDYWRRFTVPGYRLVRHSQQHFVASTALYIKRKPRH